MLLWHPQDELYFFCRNCDRAGYQPFLLSNTSGLEFFIKETRDMTAAGSSMSTWLALQHHGCLCSFASMCDITINLDAWGLACALSNHYNRGSVFAVCHSSCPDVRCNADVNVQVPNLTMSMGYQNTTSNGKVSYTQLCGGSSLNNPQFPVLGKVPGGLRRVTVLFQNSWRSCIPYLDQVTSFRLQSIGATSRVSFCMDDIQLLPSTLQPAGKR